MSQRTQESSLDAETLSQYETEYVLHPWRVQKGLTRVIVDYAKGNYFYDTSGRQYLDFTSQLAFCNLGHGDERVVAAVREQAGRLFNATASFGTEPKARFAKLLAEITPGDIRKTFFSTSGAEANEGAIKLARLASGKHKIIARYRSYHGSTFGAMTLSSDPRGWACEPAIPGVVHCLGAYCYRCPFGAIYPNCDLLCAKHVEEVVRLEGGARRVAAIIGEPIAGANGVIDAPDGYWQRIREICDKYEIAMISDKMMTGFDRTDR